MLIHVTTIANKCTSDYIYTLLKVSDELNKKSFFMVIEETDDWRDNETTEGEWKQIRGLRIGEQYINIPGEENENSDDEWKSTLGEWCINLIDTRPGTTLNLNLAIFDPDNKTQTLPSLSMTEGLPESIVNTINSLRDSIRLSAVHLEPSNKHSERDRSL